MAEPLKAIVEHAKKERRVPAISAVLHDGTIVEMTYDPVQLRTGFAVWREGNWTMASAVPVDPSHRLVPYSPNNNLIKNGIVLFPSTPEEYGSEAELVADIQRFIHRYVDVSALFEKIAAYYVLFTWVYDGFNELPYLRLRGDPGSGKTRFLLTVGALCYKPIFASGASTVSPLFRLLDTFHGTLVIDESDFRLSDERAEVVKILNNGNGKGFPVLRSEPTGKGEFNPRAYHVFGPKLVATRGFFEDRALESRCLTEEMGQHGLRNDVPINLHETYHESALTLRNKLLFFRFRTLGRCTPSEALVDRAIEPRLNQIFVPLLSIIDDRTAREELRELARQYHRDQISDRGMDTEAQVLEVINQLILTSESSRLSIKDVTALFADRYGEEYERKVTNRWIGSVIRKRLGLKPYKSDGTFVIGLSHKNRAALDRLAEKYGLRGGGNSEEQEHDSEDTGPEESPDVPMSL